MQGLVQEHCFQPLVVPRALEEVQVADVLRSKGSSGPGNCLRTAGWGLLSHRSAHLLSSDLVLMSSLPLSLMWAEPEPTTDCPGPRRSSPLLTHVSLSTVCSQAQSCLLTFPKGTCRKPRLPSMRRDWVREKAVKP